MDTSSHRPIPSPPAASRWTTLVLALAVLMGGLWSTPHTAFAEAESTVATTPAEQDKGPGYVKIQKRASTHEENRIKLTVFLDFFCSHCHKFDMQVIPVLEKSYGDRLEVTYIGFPIVDAQASDIPVLAFYLAEEQGKGDAMRLGLFEAIWDHRLDVTRPDILLGIAQRAGLDLEEFKRGFNDGRMKKRLQQGIDDARDVGVRGTPSLLIDNNIRINDNSMRNLEAVFAMVLGETE